jgi:flagellar motor component MotA
MDNIIGIGLLVFCAWSGFNVFNNSADAVTIKQYIELFVSGVGGIFILYSSNKEKLVEAINKVSKLINNKSSNINNDTTNTNLETTKEEDKMENTNAEQDKSLDDFKCLVYLRNRCVELNCPEALELVGKLNTTFFDLKIKEQKNAQT